MFFNILATFAEFEVELLRMRTREGMAIARSKGKLKGKQPKLTPRQQAPISSRDTAAASTPSPISPNSSPSPGRWCTGSWSAGEGRSPHEPGCGASYLTERSRYAYGLRRGQDQGIRSGRRAAVSP
ncbi:recombinase family protein [Streptomyces sp. NPDC051993]|uniref:recombinase family protein n=1 Tax=Streptomyces sp. NPDC051993 TaxID=3155286 RepID=UPI00342AAEA0